MAIKDLIPVRKHFFFCNGESCKLKGAAEATEAARAAIDKLNLSNVVHTTKTLCNGRCKDGPIVIALPEGYWFKQMKVDKAERFVTDFVAKGRVHHSDVLYVFGTDHISPVEKT